MIETAISSDTPRPHVVRHADMRRHQRVKVALLGRYMLSDRQEYPCQTVDMSPGGVRLTCAVLGQVGERIVLYLEQIGRIEGTIARMTAGGIAVKLSATLRKRDKIASQLTWLANRETLGLPEGRTHERLVPIQPGIVMRLESGREIAARIIDLSMSGAALSTVTVPQLGASVTLGRTPARVVRYFEGGIGVQFMLPISPDRFHEGLTL
ncbi:pilus assembly protein PilZ [Methylobacterium sp. Leaf399]|uniref:PilZ domain-containing protein n=1 Tax=unclassified Methylobacterium TaxID=2615210 RepID=UPI0006FD9BB0|nr:MULTISPECIES: PilZ domain-containing protein [unclassified Methylobacterium]KQP50769.1 pilus assembly protein PilZ [Methylobacterium sp. Leaf108]KQT07749.1 pilus assembly protein PilZ [Methylobacterium sp. Leaf399]KQT82132.1 pilus assembly protein PilZ [Methylobacterium sp. Leaf466]